jgi:adenylate cyclase class 2
VEIEAKFFIPARQAMRSTILDHGGRVLSGRYLERNFRLDDQETTLAGRDALLRLRQGARMTLTYKQGTAQFEKREEIEIEVDDFDRALELLTSLGFSTVAIYEKYREVFHLEPVTLMLDELPFGCFLEIEGPDLASIQKSAAALELDWEERVQSSYLSIVSRLREALGFEFSEVTFENFDQMDPVPFQALRQAIGQVASDG